MRTGIIAPLASAGIAVAAAIAFAPAAAATNSVECEDTSVTSVCTETGHSAIVPTPGGSDNPMGNFGYWPSGAGPAPPIWALD